MAEEAALVIWLVIGLVSVWVWVPLGRGARVVSARSRQEVVDQIRLDMSTNWTTSLAMRKKPFGLQDLGRQISLARVASGLTQAELGRRIGAQRQSIYRLECGGRQPGALVLRSIALALDVTTDSLLGMEAGRSSCQPAP